MPIKYIDINGHKYKAVEVNSYEDYKYLIYRIRTVKQKIKTFENGTTGDVYRNYPALLEYLEKLL
jgi:uncharacterized protein YigE (DUF2233 family)